jgi:hypothetical protein
MEIIDTYGKVVNLSSSKNVDESLKLLNLTPKKIESLVKTKKQMVAGKDFDIILDMKPKINQLYIYLSPKKFSKKILKMLNPDKVEFLSMVVYLGLIEMMGQRFEVRLGAIGEQTSDLVRAVIEHKK